MDANSDAEVLRQKQKVRDYHAYDHLVYVTWHTEKGRGEGDPNSKWRRYEEITHVTGGFPFVRIRCESMIGAMRRCWLHGLCFSDHTSLG